MDSSELKQVIIDWLDDNYHFGEAEELIKDDDTSFLDNGILTSLGFVQLIIHLEDMLGITIDRAALTRENFDSIGKIVGYTLGLREGR